MKITITRSFERTRQIADFVPIKAYCEATAEVEITSHHSEISESTTAKQVSDELAAFCASEVEKTLINYRPVCISCGGKGDTVTLNKEGVCGQCVKDWSIKASELRANAKKSETPKQRSLN